MSSEGSASFNISVHAGDDVVVLELDGEFDMAEVDVFGTCMAGIVGSSDGAVVVDLAGVTFIDSSALSALLNARRDLAGEGRDLRLAHLTGPVTRIFQLAGLTDLLDDTGADAR